MRSANSTPPVGVNRAKWAPAKRRKGRRSAITAGDQISRGSPIASRHRSEARTQPSSSRATIRVPVGWKWLWPRSAQSRSQAACASCTIRA